MNTGDVQKTNGQDVIAMAERIFRGAMLPANREARSETCPFTLEAVASCPARGGHRDEEPCPYSLERCTA